jgi:hypothetical protein
MSSSDRYIAENDCDICAESFPESDGSYLCKDHFYCDPCTVDMFQRSLRYLDEFPASCCFPRTSIGMPPAPLQALLGEEFMEKYRLRLLEHETPHCLRVYCADPRCARIQQNDNSDIDVKSNMRSLPPCECGMTTCAECKAEWKPGHQCETVSAPMWEPEYSASHLAKPCPLCKNWVELMEACNHITCGSCRYQFCFVCLKSWQGFHADEGCPSYDDPAAGYDKDGFEISSRGLHLFAGRDRAGFDRFGLNAAGRHRNAVDKEDEEDAEYEHAVQEYDGELNVTGLEILAAYRHQVEVAAQRADRSTLPSELTNAELVHLQPFHGANINSAEMS